MLQCLFSLLGVFRFSVSVTLVKTNYVLTLSMVANGILAIDPKTFWPADQVI